MIAFAAGLVTFVLLDGVWLGLLMGGVYRTALGPLARTHPDGSLAPIGLAAVPVYVLLALGEYWFIVPRAAGAAWTTAAVGGWRSASSPTACTTSRTGRRSEATALAWHSSILPGACARARSSRSSCDRSRASGTSPTD